MGSSVVHTPPVAAATWVGQRSVMSLERERGTFLEVSKPVRVIRSRPRGGGDDADAIISLESLTSS